MKFDAMWVSGVNALGKIVKFLGDLMRLRFEDRDAAKYEVFLVQVVSRTGVVQVEKVHAQ
jgi:hypothetical protein